MRISSILIAGFACFFCLPIKVLASQEIIPLCADQISGVVHYPNSPGTYRITARGTWTGNTNANRRDIYDARGSQNRPKHRQKFIAPNYPPGSLLLSTDTAPSWVYVGTEIREISLTGNAITFIFNDERNAYHDNAGCIEIFLTKIRSDNRRNDPSNHHNYSDKNLNGIWVPSGDHAGGPSLEIRDYGDTLVATDMQGNQLTFTRPGSNKHYFEGYYRDERYTLGIYRSFNAISIEGRGRTVRYERR